MTDTTETVETGVIVANPLTGEIVENVRTADAFDLAEVVDAIATKRADLAAIEAIVLDELRRRLDRRGKWTLKLGDPGIGVVHEVTAPSPTAGTTTVDADPLRRELVALLNADAIDVEAANAALRRSVTVTAQVGPDVDLETLVAKLKGIDAIAGVPVVDVTAGADEKVVHAGVNALRKAGHGAAVDAATREVPAPSRKAKVKTTRRPVRA